MLSVRLSLTLNHETYELLCAERYHLAEVMLKFGLSMKKHGDDLSRKMMVVNLAIAAKSLGNEGEALKILENEDWSASSEKFHICVAAVKNEVEEVIRYLPKFVGSEEITKNDFREWPAFSSVRSDPSFIKAFEKVFGEAFVLDRGSQVDRTFSTGEESQLEPDSISVPAPKRPKNTARGKSGKQVKQKKKT